MTIIRWNQSLSVEIESIDNQHKILLQILNDFNIMIKEDILHKELKNQFEKLIDYASEHFSKEESYMKQCNYGDYEKHRGIHIEFIQQMVEFSEKINSGSKVVIFEIIKYLENWIVEHIKDKDRKYMSYFKLNGIK